MTQAEKSGRDDEASNAESECLVTALVTVGKNESAETPKSLVVHESCEEEGCSAGTGIRTRSWEFFNYAMLHDFSSQRVGFLLF
jgi:hypothetical protein